MVEALRNFSGLTGINNYVPGMGYSAGMRHGQPTIFSLGTPADADPDGIDTDIDSDATAGTETSQSYTADSPYGRTLAMQQNADPGAALGIYDVYGKDYLGQPMVERFTHVNGSTPIQYGKKAFYTVDNVVVVTAATNATTCDLGWGYRLGLPYKGDVVWARENGVLVPVHKFKFTQQGSLGDADVTSGGSLIWLAPFPGYVETLYATPCSGGSTTNAATTVEIETVAVTGLTVTADQDTQTTVSDTPTTTGYNANNRFRPYNRIEIVHAATTAGGITAYALDLIPTQFTPADETDAATVTTGDPRGTYEPLVTMDGAKEIEVALNGDPSVNSSGNGGLHGIQHYYA